MAYDSSLRPGIYSPITIKVEDGGLNLPWSETNINIEPHPTILPYDSEFKLNVSGRFNTEGKILVGAKCGVLPGRYLLKLNSSNKISFHNIPIV